MAPPFVLRFCPEFFTGKEFNRGLTLNIFYLVRELTKLGVRHHLFTPKTNATRHGDIPVTTIPLRGRFTIYFQGRDAHKTIHTSGVKDYDLIHTHNYGFAQLYRYKNELNVPMVHSIHGSPFDIRYQPVRSLRHFKEMMYAYLFTKYIAKRADHIVVMSTNYKNDMVKYYGTDPGKITFIPPQVDADLFYPQKCEKDIDLLYTGRFVTLKHVPFAVEITRILKKTNPNVKTYLVGGGPGDNEYDRVVDLIKKYGLEKNVFIVPPVTHKELVRYINRAKVFYFVAFSHGVGKSLLEAMACQIPYVTNMAPAEGEASFTDKEGFSALPLDAETYAKKVNMLLSDDALRKKLGRAARQKVLDYYTPQVTGKKTFMLYKTLLR